MADPENLSVFSAKYNALNSMVQDFCNAFPINDLFPTMITCRVIDFTEKEDICAERTERGRVSTFLAKLSGELKIWNEARFDRFLEMMKRSHKCTFLRNRLLGRIDQFAQSSASSPPPNSSAGSTQASKPANSSAGDSSSEVVNTLSPGGKYAASCMRLMRKHVIPRICAEWETVSAYLEYSIPFKNAIKKKHSGDPKACCTELIENWVTSSNGVKPKSWDKLVGVLSEINELRAVTQDIRYCLQFDGIALDVTPVEDTNSYSEPEPYNHRPPGDNGPSSLNTIPSGVLPPLDQQPSYDEYQHQQYTAAANRQPQVPSAQASATLPPQVFIMYAKDDDPTGDKVFNLSHVLRKSGVNSDADIYHANENVQDWSFWVNKAIEHCATTTNGYILLICSQAMISILEETTDNVRVQMVYGHIDRLTLRHLIVSNTRKFIPVFISDHSDPEYVPPSLSGKTFYHFPYELINQYPQDVSPEVLLRYKEFASFKGLVATLTGQTENPPPHIGQVFPLSPAKSDAPSFKTAQAPPTNSVQKPAIYRGSAPTYHHPTNYGNDDYLNLPPVNGGVRNTSRAPPQGNYTTVDPQHMEHLDTGLLNQHRAVNKDHLQGGNPPARAQHDQVPYQGDQNVVFQHQAGQVQNRSSQSAGLQYQGDRNVEYQGRSANFQNQAGQSAGLLNQGSQFHSRGGQNATLQNRGDQNNRFQSHGGQNVGYHNQNAGMQNQGNQYIGTGHQDGRYTRPHNGAHVSKVPNPTFVPGIPPANTGGAQAQGGHHLAGPAGGYAGGMHNIGSGAPHKLNLRDPNTATSMPEQDTPNTPTNKQLGNGDTKGPSMDQTAAPPIGYATPPNLNRRPLSLGPSPNYDDFGHGAPSHRHTTSLGQSMPSTTVPQRLMTSHHGMSSQYTVPTLRAPQNGIPQQPFGREPHLIYQPSSTTGRGMGRVYDDNMLESNVSSVSQVPQHLMTSHHGMSSQYARPQDGIPQQPSSTFGREPHFICQPSSTVGGGFYDDNLLNKSNVSSVSQVPQHLMSSQGGIPPDSLSTLGREPPLIGQPSSALGELGPSYDDNILESHVSGFESHVSGQGVSQAQPSMEDSQLRSIHTAEEVTLRTGEHQIQGHLPIQRGTQAYQPPYHQHSGVQGQNYYKQNSPLASTTVAEQCSDEPSILVLTSKNL